MPQVADPPAEPKPDAPRRPDTTLHRSLSGPIERIRAEDDGDDKVHRYQFKASSDSPVEMWRGVYEILDHTAEGIRLDWLNSGNAPALDMHNRWEQVGVIESARLEGQNIIVTVRVAPSQTDLIKDLEAGIIRNVSIGYRVHNEHLESREVDEQGDTIKATWRVTDWEPTEVSFVSIPADKSVGLGRSDEETAELKTRVKFLEHKLQSDSDNKPDPNRSQPNTTMPETADPPKKPSTIEIGEARQQRDDAVKAERERVAAINAIAGKARESGLGNHADTAAEFIEKGRSVEEFQRHVLDNVEKTPTVTQRELGVSDKDANRYDLTKVVNGLTRGDMSGCEHELEVSDAIKERAGRSNDRVAIPLDVLMRGYLPKDARQRDLVSVTLSGGGQTDTANHVVDNELLDQMFIESLRESSPVLGLGVTMLPGLTGDVTIPRELVNPDFYWVGEDAEPTEGTYDLDDISLSFKTLAARVPFTRQAMKQTTPNIEALLTNSLRRGQAIALEQALINGAGGSAPTGILQTAGIGSVSAATLSHAKLLELEESLGNANADTSGSVLLTNTRGKRRLLETEKATNTGIFLAAREGADLQTDIGRVVCTNNVPNNLGGGTDRSAIIFGNFRSLIVGMWGAMEIARDTATKAPTGGVVLRVFSDVDAVVSRPAEFAAIQDLS